MKLIDLDNLTTIGAILRSTKSGVFFLSIVLILQIITAGNTAGDSEIYFMLFMLG
jgi:hypothetical protein